MSYNSANLSLLAQAAGPIGCKLWVYDSVEVTTDFDIAGYISDAKERGMEKGDMVLHRIWTTAAPTTTAEKQTAAGTANILTDAGWHIVMGISTAGAADLANETAITVTNSD